MACPGMDPVIAGRYLVRHTLGVGGMACTPRYTSPEYFASGEAPESWVRAAARLPQARPSVPPRPFGRTVAPAW